MSVDPNTYKNNSANSIILDDRVSEGINESLNALTQILTETRPPQTKLQGFLKHPLVLVLVSFVLTILIGGYFAYYLNKRLKDFELFKAAQQKEVEYARLENQKKYDIDREEREKRAEYKKSLIQKEIDRDRNFIYELNKLRIAKVIKIWEMIDDYEYTAFNIAAVPTNDSMFPLKEYMKVRKAITEDNPKYKELILFLNKSKFVIGDELYENYSHYINISIETIVGTSSSLRSHPPKEPIYLEEGEQQLLDVLGASNKSTNMLEVDDEYPKTLKKLNKYRADLRDSFIKARDRLLTK